MEDEDIKSTNFTLACENYLEKNVVASYVAFYLASSYSFDYLGKSTLKQHFNSAVDVFNIELQNEDALLKKIEKILRKKYFLEIVNKNPLEFKEI